MITKKEYESAQELIRDYKKQMEPIHNKECWIVRGSDVLLVFTDEDRASFVYEKSGEYITKAILNPL